MNARIKLKMMFKLVEMQGFGLNGQNGLVVPLHVKVVPNTDDADTLVLLRLIWNHVPVVKLDIGWTGLNGQVVLHHATVDPHTEIATIPVAQRQSLLSQLNH